MEPCHSINPVLTTVDQAADVGLVLVDGDKRNQRDHDTERQVAPALAAEPREPHADDEKRRRKTAPERNVVRDPHGHRPNAEHQIC